MVRVARKGDAAPGSAIRSPEGRPSPAGRGRPSGLTTLDASSAFGSSPPFAHPSEAEFARILDFYGVKWEYEPRSFPLRWEDGRVAEALTPDFYLPDLDRFVELTTLKQSLVTVKNRKLRRMRELYPDVNVRLLYRRDYHRLLAKFGYGPLVESAVAGVSEVLFTASQIEARVAELGRQLSDDYRDRDPVLVGVLRGVLPFMADLMRQITVPLSLDLMSISYYGPEQSGVRITKDLDIDLAGRHVLMVEDIVDTGMTLNYLLEELSGRGPSSLEVCALLDKRARRLVDVPLKYVGFATPDEFVVGYGLDHLEQYRNLPFIGLLRPEDGAGSPGKKT